MTFLYAVNLRLGDCNFEDFIMCGYVQDRSASIDWIRGHGSTLTGKTGPSTDHTIGDKTGTTELHYFNQDVYLPPKYPTSAIDENPCPPCLMC